MQGAQDLRSEAHLQLRRNGEVAAQRCRWIFCETIKVYLVQFGLGKAKFVVAWPLGQTISL